MEKEGRRGGQSEVMWEELDLPSLALEMEEGVYEPKNVGGLQNLEKARIDFSLEMNTTALKPWF